jgi:mycothione reductase
MVEWRYMYKKASESKPEVKEYDLISIGTGSAMNIVDAMLQKNPNLKVAVIDKDEPGGICLTRGCIPSKLLLYPAELIRIIEERADELGLDVQINKIDFRKVMHRMRSHINEEIEGIRNGLSQSKNIDYYHDVAEFVEPYTLMIRGNNDEHDASDSGDDDNDNDDDADSRINHSVVIKSKMIFLCTGSKPLIPPIDGLQGVKYYTSDTILSIDQLPKSIAIIGGGYIAAEYGHFFSSMGSDVTIVGRNEQFLPDEEPEVSALAKRELGEHMTIITNNEVIQVRSGSSNNNGGGNSSTTITASTAVREAADNGGDNNDNDEDDDSKEKKNVSLVARDQSSGKRTTISAQMILVATGRGPNTDLLHPERSGIDVNEEGWIVVDDYLETSQKNIWAFGDANGVFPFKHKANYESQLVYYNAVLRKKIRKYYGAVPHAVFTYPEVASVGLIEREAIQKYGENNILLGIARYEDTARGSAMGIKDYFVKVIVKKDTLQILGAHIIGPDASVLIQEIINIMYAKQEDTVRPILDAMHIHPALSEVVQRSFSSLMSPRQYHHVIGEHFGLLGK